MHTNQAVIMRVTSGFSGDELSFEYTTLDKLPENTPIGEAYRDAKHIWSIIHTLETTKQVIEYTLTEIGRNYTEIGRIEAYKRDYTGIAYVWQEPFNAWDRQKNSCKQRIEKLQTQLAELYRVLYTLETN